MNINQIVAQKLIERLKVAEETGEKFYWIKPFAKNCPRTSVSYMSQKEYRGINRILLEPSKEMVSYSSLQKLRNEHPDANYHIRKGSHGNIVIYFDRVPVTNDDGEPKVDEKTGLTIMKSFTRYYTVFDREDIIDKNGINLPSKFPIEQFDHRTEEEQLELALLKFTAIVKSYCSKHNIAIEETLQGTEAYFMPSKNIVRIPSKESFPSISAYCQCMFHELVHSSMLPLSRNKTDNDMTIEESMKSYSIEELIAELGSAILMASINLPTEETEKNSISYLHSWSNFLSKPEKQKSLIYAASQAEKAAQLIVSEFERNLEELKQQAFDNQVIETDTTKSIDEKENQNVNQI